VTTKDSMRWLGLGGSVQLFGTVVVITRICTSQVRWVHALGRLRQGRVTPGKDPRTQSNSAPPTVGGRGQLLLISDCCWATRNGQDKDTQGHSLTESKGPSKTTPTPGGKAEKCATEWLMSTRETHLENTRSICVWVSARVGLKQFGRGQEARVVL
jgi:hypothetical protein